MGDIKVVALGGTAKRVAGQHDTTPTPGRELWILIVHLATKDSPNYDMWVNSSLGAGFGVVGVGASTVREKAYFKPCLKAYSRRLKESGEAAQRVGGRKAGRTDVEVVRIKLHKFLKNLT